MEYKGWQEDKEKIVDQLACDMKKADGSDRPFCYEKTEENAEDGKEKSKDVRTFQNNDESDEHEYAARHHHPELPVEPVEGLGDRLDADDGR